MPRHDPSDKTKSEILQTAVRLFGEKGWDNVKIEDVVKEVGVTRGAFYHYFKSREDLVYAVIMQTFLDNNPYALASKQEGLNALEKLRFGLRLNYSMSSNPALVKEFKKIFDNPAAFKSSILLSINIGAPFIEKLILEGNEDGSISVAHPKQTAEILILLFNLWLEQEIFQVSYQEWLDKISFIEYLGKLLGILIINDEIKEILLKENEYWKQS